MCTIFLKKRSFGRFDAISGILFVLGGVTVMPIVNLLFVVNLAEMFPFCKVKNFGKKLEINPASFAACEHI